MQGRILIIAGMHRSGTSLITNWLHRCGLQVGENLVGANAGNKEGHFEDTEFLKMHEEILTDNGYPSTGLVAGANISVSEYHLEKLKAIIHIKNKHFEQWGWKEPRTCLFLDQYRKLLPQAKYLVITRDYGPVVNSLLKRDFEAIDVHKLSLKFSKRIKWKMYRRNRARRKYYREYAEDYLKVWIDYNERILAALKHLMPENYLVVNYMMLQKKDRDVFSFLTGKWGFTLNYVTFGEVYKENLISPKANIEPFIRDKALLSRVEEIENEFKGYITIS